MLRCYCTNLNPIYWRRFLLLCRGVTYSIVKTHSGLFSEISCYLFGKGGNYVFGSVGLSVCLSVDNSTQNVMNGLG